MIPLRPVINEHLCVGCGACSRVCPQGAIVMRPREIRQMSASERVGALENKIRTLGERLEGVESTIEEIKKRCGDKMAGQGRMGGVGLGPSGYCVCPNCGYKTPHVAGTPCFDQTCPKCGSKMIREK